MRIAFYAPMKPPDDPVPSGDRTMARLLIEALERSGHEVEIASRLRSRDRHGDARRQARLQALGLRLAERFVRGAERRGRLPELWLTYHLYDKAPDWIGPRAAELLRIPYVAAEASVAAKRRDGPWRLGYAAVLAALQRAAAVITLSSADRDGIAPHLAARDRQHPLRPFLVAAPFAAARAGRAEHRTRLAREHGLPTDIPWLIAVAMMRPGDKLASYRLLAEALSELRHVPWRLLVIGDGAARSAVTAAFAATAERVAWLGALDAAALTAALAAADLFVWPAINEAFGLALLEAQAAGLPVLAGASGGVRDIVADGTTGRLTPPGDRPAFVQALAELLADPRRMAMLGLLAEARAGAIQDIDFAATRLDGILRMAVAVARRL